jgi:hypothetical protein
VGVAHRAEGFEDLGNICGSGAGEAGGDVGGGDRGPRGREGGADDFDTLGKGLGPGELARRVEG